MLEQSKSGSNIKHSGKFLQPRRAERKRLGSVEKLLLCAIQRILYWTSITNVLDLFFYRPDNIQRIGGTKKEVVLLFCFFVCLCHAFLLCDYMMDAVHSLLKPCIPTVLPIRRNIDRFSFLQAIPCRKCYAIHIKSVFFSYIILYYCTFINISDAKRHSAGDWCYLHGIVLT